MKEFLIGCASSVLLTFTITFINADMQVSVYKKAEQICVLVNSHAYSFDRGTVTCENGAVVHYQEFKGEK